MRELRQKNSNTSRLKIFKTRKRQKAKKAKYIIVDRENSVFPELALSSHSCCGKAETFHIIKLIDYRMNQQIDFIFDIIRSSKSIFSIEFILGLFVLRVLVVRWLLPLCLDLRELLG